MKSQDTFTMEKQLILTMAALITIFVAFILIVVGVSSRGWATLNGHNVDVGLLEGLSPFFSSSEIARARAIYALCVLSTLCASAALPLTFGYGLLQVTGKTDHRAYGTLRMSIFGVSIAGGTLGMCGSAFHALNQGLSQFFSATAMSRNIYLMPGYSFYLTVIGSIALTVGGRLVQKTKTEVQTNERSTPTAVNSDITSTTVPLDHVTKGA
ncbi:hypothetical protein Btru_047191 [Bulinus truncatus]|nr:hypothetical protein Btru_047191 [Bulinus truncatus]